MPDIAEQIVKPDPITTLRALVEAKEKATAKKQRYEKAKADGAPYYSLCGFHNAFQLEVSVLGSAAFNTDFAALLRAFEELQFEVEKWKAATGMDDPIEFSQQALSDIATMNKKLKVIEANLKNQPERP